MMLIQGSGNMAVLLEVSSGLLYHSDLDTYTHRNVYNTGCRINGGFFYSH